MERIPQERRPPLLVLVLMLAALGFFRLRNDIAPQAAQVCSSAP